ncbi:MAG: Phosphoglycerate mutase [Firmicutes bacterium]|nr:Phosphoglycerate mutase [Bacillota bacterium]
MSKKIWLIRHGESTANAGSATDNHETIPLSPKGWKQAEQISLLFKGAPSLIITSPFTRTRQTAEPTLRRFPNVRHEVWDVQEFTYLAPHTCTNTTAAERKARVNEYWNRVDPNDIDGEGAESFSMLLSRAKIAIDHLKRLEDGFIVMFTHAQFMRAMHILKANNTEDAKALMKQFRELPRFENCQVVEWDNDKTADQESNI